MQRPTMQNLLRLTETQSSRLYHGYRKGVKRVLRKRVRRPRRAQKSGVMNSFGRHAEGACRSTGSVVGGNMITKTTLRPYKREGWERLGEQCPREKKTQIPTGRHAEGACRSMGSVVGGNMITKTTLRPYKREGWERLGERRPREKKDAESHGSRDCVSAAETSSRAPWDSKTIGWITFLSPSSLTTTLLRTLPRYLLSS